MTDRDVSTIAEALYVARDRATVHARTLGFAPAVGWVLVAHDFYAHEIERCIAELRLPPRRVEDLPPVLREYVVQALRESGDMPVST